MNLIYERKIFCSSMLIGSRMRYVIFVLGFQSNAPTPHAPVEYPPFAHIISYAWFKVSSFNWHTKGLPTFSVFPNYLKGQERDSTTYIYIEIYIKFIRHLNCSVVRCNLCIHFMNLFVKLLLLLFESITLGLYGLQPHWAPNTVLFTKKWQ